MGTLAVVELAARSGLPKDKVVNTFSIAETGAVPGSGSLDADYLTALARVYTASLGAPVSASLGSLLANALTRDSNACSIKLYDITGHLDGSPHGSPRATSSFTLPAASEVNSLPAEVALCCTLEANNRELQMIERPDGVDPGSAPDRPRQRYTGRVYFGPWVAGVNDASPPNYAARPTTAAMSAIRMAVQRLADEIAAASSDEASLGVWSRADEAIRGIEFTRSDDAWDTQRRRGPAPTSITRLAVSELIPEIELAS